MELTWNLWHSMHTCPSDTVNGLGSEDGARYDMHVLKCMGYLTDLVNNHAQFMQFIEARIELT
jgi:hypothetical protein